MDKILAFDSFGAASIYDLLQDISGLKIDMEWNFEEIVNSLRNGSYRGFVVEPFVSFNNPSMQRELSDLMTHSRKKGLKVIVYTTEPLEKISQEFKLVRGTHYNEYVHKLTQSVEILKEYLLQQ